MSREIRGHAPARKILKSRVSEIPFPAFWGKILHNYEGLKKSYKILKKLLSRMLNTFFESPTLRSSRTCKRDCAIKSGRYYERGLVYT